jgi:hypothetical protein
MKLSLRRTIALCTAAAGCAAAGVLALAACGDNQTIVPTIAAYEGGVTPLSCVPNLDGKIESREAQPAIGVPATYLVSPQGRDRQVNVAGSVDKDGHQTWDFGTSFADDRAAVLQASNIAGKWYASSFPPNAFVTPFDAGATTEAVYVKDDAALRILGFASTEPNPPEGKTLVVYSTPVDVLRFPLAPGLSWTSSAEAKNATLRGLPFASKDTYEIRVDGSGRVTLPDLIVTQAMRVRTKLTVEPSAGATTTQRQTIFLFECLGEVARATSKIGETNDDFTTASELRRLGLAR